VYRAYSVSTDNVLMWMCELSHAVQRRKFIIVYICVLLVGDGVKRGPIHIVQCHVGLARHAGG
jgi:hypothetical protein